MRSMLDLEKKSLRFYRDLIVTETYTKRGDADNRFRVLMLFDAENGHLELYNESTQSRCC
jgi:hypothetical protein